MSGPFAGAATWNWRGKQREGSKGSSGVRAMSQDAALYNLASAGYLILQESEEARLTNEYRRNFGPYSGVDRLPALFPPEAAVRQAIGEPPVQESRLYATLEEWFDFCSGNTAFIPGLDQALRLLKAFQACGFRFELVYCQLAWKEGEEDRLSSYATTDEQAPVVSRTYGFDVSWPTCKHSAILQPGVVPSSLPWRQKLNQFGLLNDYQDAAELRAEYLAAYPYPPFDIYMVHSVGYNEKGYV